MDSLQSLIDQMEYNFNIRLKYLNAYTPLTLSNTKFKNNLKRSMEYAAVFQFLNIFLLRLK